MDTLCLKSGIIAPPISVGGGGSLEAARVNTLHVSAAVNREKSGQPQKSASKFSFRYPLQSLWPGGGKSNRSNGLAVDDAVLVENGVEDAERKTIGSSEGNNNENWVLKILHVRSLWKDDQEKNTNGDDEGSNVECDEVAVKSDINNDEEEEEEEEDEEDEDEEECISCRVPDDDEKQIEFDRDSFSRLLRKASLAEAKLYAQISYLGNLAYCIPKMKAGNLLKYRGLQYVTSSIDKREIASKAEKLQVPNEVQEAEEEELLKKETESKEQKKNNPYHISPAAAYHIAASAASYLHSHTKSILPFNSSKTDGGKDSSEGCSAGNKNVGVMNSEVASFMATTDSVTAVVAAKEEVKQAVADDLSSTRSSPCEWFICDDDQATRFFVIQGSESLASWQANLLFEPVQFEGLDVLVHRGIYEAAKGMYDQMLPEVRAHLKLCGRRAAFRFTGHSLGGSLSLLVNLMLLIRGEVPASSLLPVITFGAPSVMCGGDRLLRKLGLPRSHVQAITMHRDIVPRAFSCNYPNHVAELLKAVNGSFRNHPCLNNQKLLYAPTGELLILQPDEKYSPHHHLLPSGSGLYFLNIPLSDNNDAEKLLRAAQTVFLNSPHPLEILSDRTAYGSEGAIHRDHDIGAYLKSVRSVIRQELNQIRKARREHRRKFWWSLLAPRGIGISTGGGGGVIMERPLVSVKIGENNMNFSGVLQTGKESLKRFSRLVASQHMHLLVILLFPARLLVVGAFSISNF